MKITSHHSPLLLSILAALSGCSAGGEDPTSPPVLADAGSAMYEGDGCYNVSAETTTCLGADEVNLQDLFAPWTCSVEVTDVLGEGNLTTVSSQVGDSSPACCYPVTGIDRMPGCVIGRPYFERGAALMAPVGEGNEAGAGGERLTQGKAWALAGAGEHASVAAFARLSLQLMACGAPTDLLSATHQAAVDEVKHAEACWELAERFGTKRINAGAFPFREAINPSTSLADLAVATVREGCLAETLGAHLAAVAAERTADPEVKRVLTSIAEEEARHSVLSFRIVAWALQAGDPSVRTAVMAALAQPWPQVDVDELAVRAGVAPVELARASSQGVAQVLLPAVRHLVSA